MKQKIFSILRWSERYTKTDMVYLAKAGLWLNSGKFISTLLNIVLVVFFANLVSATIYGEYKFLMSFLTILSIPSLNGMGESLVRSVSRGSENSIYAAIKIKLKWGLGGSFASLLISYYYLLQNNSSLSISFLIIAFFIPLINSFRLWSEYLNGKREYKIISILNVLFEIVKITGLILTILVNKHSLIILIFVYFLLDALMKIVILKITLKKFPPNKTDDNEMVSYGKKLSLVKILKTVSGQIDKILLFYFLGAYQLAVYSFASRPFIEIRNLIASLITVSAPKISNSEYQKLQRSIPEKIYKFLIILIPIIVVVIFILPFLYNLLFPNYSSSIIYAQVLVASLIFFPKNLIDQIFISHKKTKELNRINYTVSFLKIILFVFLLPMYGIWGAIATIIFSDLVHFILLYSHFLKGRHLA